MPAYKKKKSKSSIRAQWDEDDVRKLYNFKRRWLDKNPRGRFLPKYAHKLFKPAKSSRQIKTFVTGPRIRAYEEEHMNIEALHGRVFRKLDFSHKNHC